MVSLQAALSAEEKKTTCPDLECFLTTKKRKSRDGLDDQESEDNLFMKPPKLVKAEEEEAEEIELNLLDSPLPLEWQRCLDIKSGQIHYYNTRTQRRTSRDPRLSLEPAIESSPLSLDLELNLTCEPPRVSHTINGGGEERVKQQGVGSTGKTCDSSSSSSSSKYHKKSGGGASWMSLDEGNDQEEMVAAVCMRCNMLVMMRKAALSCPNCNFVHPPDHTSSTTLLKPAAGLFKLLC